MMRSDDLRRKFLDYFVSGGHEILPSAPLVPQHDPTLLFINAGMAPLKDYFTGARARPAARAASAQKCLRAGGKHNDLDNVGYTARHHTFFEMMGNFSFGDYFKEEAIHYAWELVAGELALPHERLLITVYDEDDEAAALWRKISGLPDAQIQKLAGSDNFWSMGETGPCGPCSEIFYDHGEHIKGAPPHKGGEGDRFVEIWNLVFMQYETLPDGTRRDLPKPAIDTGMGLERMAAVMQGTHDNYETDSFKALVAASSEITGQKVLPENIASHRVIADHLRAVCFLIADGVSPDNEGRGYVLRRIMRRAMSHGHLLGVREPCLFRLCAAVEQVMGEAWPELARARAIIVETLRQEEERFQDMLGRGLRLLEEETKKGTGGQFSGEAAFRLYDTYGFPLDLTRDILRRRNMAIDEKGFESAMAEQKQRARAAWSGSGDAASALDAGLLAAIPPTNFTGYEQETGKGQILGLFVEGAAQEGCREGEACVLVLDSTPFYAESGGQVGDSGSIETSGGVFEVVAVNKQQNIHLHQGRVVKGEIKQGDTVQSKIDAPRRDCLRANHSATHLLNAALHEVLGEHVTQKGSLVAPDYLRFDFTHRAPLEPTELDAIEAIVNRQIRTNSAVETDLMPQTQAMSKGAMTVPGEAYPEEVRVLSMGDTASDGKRWSVELCAGTHARRLGDIALFCITGQSAIGAGVRRLEGMTGEAARLFLKRREGVLLEAARRMKIAPDDLPERVARMSEELRGLQVQVKQLQRKAAGGGAASGASVEDINGVRFLGRVLEGVSPRDLRGLADEAASTGDVGVVVLVAVNEGRGAIVVRVGKEAQGALDAVTLVKAGAEALGGRGGGGRPDMAQAGGPDGTKASEAIQAVRALL